MLITSGVFNSFFPYRYSRLHTKIVKDDFFLYSFHTDYHLLCFL